MAAAIAPCPTRASVKIGLQFKRRFWEQDEHIYGGITYTDLPITQISYPSTDYGAPGKGVLLGAYAFGPYAYEFTVAAAGGARREGAGVGRAIHPQYKDEFENGVSVGWHRVPWALGCYGAWTDETRAEHYKQPRSTAASCWPASTPPTFRPGRKARSSRRSTRSPACTNA